MPLPPNNQIPVGARQLCLWAIAAVTLALLSAESVADPDWQAFEAQRSARLQELVPPVEQCVARNDTQHPVFHGCVDWHSAVHGHWALLRVARSAAESRLIDVVQRSMEPAAMRAEAEFIAANPRFEMPYGRAWFLQLITEYELTTQDRQFRYFGDAVAETLARYLLSRDCKLGRSTYLNQSWAYRHLLEYYEHTGHLENAAATRTRVATCDGADVKLDRDRRKAEFFSLFSNLAHLYALALGDDEFARWHSASRPSQAALKPVSRLQTPAHHLGINLSRAWGMWSLYIRTGDPAYRRSYIAHVEEGLKRHEANLADYYGYGRWVPQFAIYALTVSERDE